jgi:methyltransferase
VGVSRIAYVVLLAAVGAGRVLELWISRRHQKLLVARGATALHEPNYPWMVFVHTTVLVAAGLEVILLQRRLIPALAISMSILFLLANALRWWVIRILGDHWNVQVVDSTRLGVVTNGPFRWVRHPNYVGVFVELVSLCLIHTAWMTAIFAGAGYTLVLRSRLRIEDTALMADPAYRAAMGDKPRFLPKLL